MKNNMTFKEWVLELLRDERGAVSIKPVVALVGSIFLCSALLINALSNKTIEFSDTLINSVMIITCVGLGADTFDKFSYKRRDGESSGRGYDDDRYDRGNRRSSSVEYEREVSVRSSKPRQEPKSDDSDGRADDEAIEERKRKEEAGLS